MDVFVFVQRRCGLGDQAILHSITATAARKTLVIGSLEKDNTEVNTKVNTGLDTRVNT